MSYLIRNRDRSEEPVAVGVHDLAEARRIIKASPRGWSLIAVDEATGQEIEIGERGLLPNPEFIKALYVITRDHRDYLARAGGSALLRVLLDEAIVADRSIDTGTQKKGRKRVQP